MIAYMRKGVFKKTLNGSESYIAAQKQLLQSQGYIEVDIEISNFINNFSEGETDHVHANKPLLDTYTQSNADIAEAIAMKHSPDGGGSEITLLDGGYPDSTYTEIVDGGGV